MDVEKICSSLVKIKSENPPGNTRDCAEYAGSILESIGIPVDYTVGLDNRTNVFSKKQDGKLLLLGHLDVVPALSDGWDRNPYSGTIDDTFVYGRGATDMKGGCASVLTALSKSVEKNDNLPISVAFVCDEEGGGIHGVRKLISEKIIHSPDCLIAEPTSPYGPCIGQKGVYRYQITFHGQPCHSALYPKFGISAIMQATEFLSWLSTLNGRDYPQTPEMEEIITHSSEVAGKFYQTDVSSIYRHISYNPGVINGGERENVVAQKCSLIVDMRLPWGISIEEISCEVQSHIPKGAEFTERAAAVASMTPPASFLVKTTCECVGRAYGIAANPMVQWAASDARALRLAGFNALEYGPGEISTMHGVNERVRIDQLRKATDIYVDIIEKYAQKGK